MEREPEFKDIGWLAWIVFVAVIAFVLPGCATTDSAVQMCGMKPIGQNGQGVTFVLMQCEPHEANQ